MTEKHQVAVLGAGMAGLMAVKGCLEEGLDPICFEQHDQIGGLWYYTETLRTNQGAASFQNLITNTSKEMSCCSDFPFPDDAPQFLTCHHYHKYLMDMAHHFNLFKHIHLNTTVVRVYPAADFKESGGWQVDVLQNGSSNVRSYMVDNVVVCSGSSTKPRHPDIPGIETFSGQFSHMIDYRVPNIFKDKNVLIVGNQNSAGDACADAGRIAKQVFWSTGEGAWIMSRVGRAGVPRELSMGRMLSAIPRRIAAAGFRRMAFDTVLNHKQYGLGHERNPVVGGPYLLNEDLVYLLQTGRVLPKPHLIQVQGNMATFSDGSEVEVDLILAATGYHPDYSLIDCPEIQGSRIKNMVLYKWTFPICEGPSSLALIGASPLVGARLPSMELQGRWIARVFAGRCRLPPIHTMEKHRGKILEFFNTECDGKLLEFGLPLQDSIAEEIGVLPTFWRLLWQTKSLKLLSLVFLGPALPAHYRLQGPGSLKDALDMCVRAHHRAFNTPNYQRQDQEIRNVGWFSVKLVFLALIAIGIAVWLVLQH